MSRRRALIVVHDQPVIADVLTLDGVQNTRAGHDASSTKWEDLSGNNYDFSAAVGTPTWLDNCLSVESNFGLARTVDLQGSGSAITIEVIAQTTGNGTYKNGNTYGGPIFNNLPAINQDGGFRIQGYRGYNSGGTLTDNGVSAKYNTSNMGYVGGLGDIRYIVWSFNGSTVTRYREAVPVASNNPISLTYPGGTKRTSWRIGYTDSYYYRGKIFYIGVSSTALSAEQIAERYQKFRRRFKF